MTDPSTRRERRDARTSVKPGPQRRAPGRTRPMWQTALIGLGLVTAALVVAITLTGEGPPEMTETAPVDVVGDALPPIPEGGDDPAVGQPAPAAAGLDFEGEAVDLLADEGSTIVVFVAHWCPVCQREVPVIVDEWTDTLPPDVRVVAVPTSTQSTQGNYPPSAWLQAEGWPFDVLVDSESSDLGQAYGVQAYPAFAVVGPDGEVRARASGELSPAGLQQLVDIATVEGAAE